MINPFWNGSEHRLRAVWRFLIQGGLYIITIFFFNAIAFIFASWVPGVIGQEAGAWIGAIVYALADLPAALLSVCACGRWLDHRRFVDFGLHFNRAWWLDLGFGLGLGAGLMTLIFLVELALGWVTITRTLRTGMSSFAGALLVGLLHFIVVGISEELFSRGYQLRNLAEGFNLGRIGPRAALWISYALTSVLFGLYHLSNPNATWLGAGNIVIAGLLLGLPYVLTGELGVSIGLHITWNFFQGKIFGFPVSGGASGTTLIAIQQNGPDLWTGGAFGPEGGLLSVPVMFLGMGLTLLWLRWRQK